MGRLARVNTFIVCCLVFVGELCGALRASRRNPSQMISLRASASEPPLIPRHSSHENFVAKWQRKGDHYVSYEQLLILNKKTLQQSDAASSSSMKESGTLNAGLSAAERRDLFSELMITYFARFHNIIREEYQFEKRAVEERLQTWSPRRLAQEGYALFDLRATPRGTLFADKVIRFHLPMGSQTQTQTQSQKLPFHRFSVGDAVKISISLSAHSSKSKDKISDSDGGGGESGQSVDGVVLDRRTSHIDVCVRVVDALRLDGRAVYRLDSSLNRISYDRMLHSLQFLLLGRSSEGESGGGGGGGESDGSAVGGFVKATQRQKGTSSTSTSTSNGNGNGNGNSNGNGNVKEKEEEAPPLSRALRDILLYSYPNGLTRLASSPGGLRLALPLTDKLTHAINANDIKRDGEKGTERESDRRRKSPSPLDKDYYRSDERGELSISSANSQPSSPQLAGLGDDSDNSPPHPSHSQNNNNNNNKKKRQRTVAEQLMLLQNTGRISGQADARKRDWGESDASGSNSSISAIFGRSKALLALSLNFPPSPSPMQGTHTDAYGRDEVEEVVCFLRDGGTVTSSKNSIENNKKGKNGKRVLNTAQVQALEAALLRPLTLIQGPPGTGKTTTAVAVMAGLHLLRERRMRLGGYAARGREKSRILACAHSNVAADNLVAGAAGAGLVVVRVGRPASIAAGLWNHSLDANLENDSMWVSARSRLDRTVQYYQSVREAGGEELGMAQRMLESAQGRFDRAQRKCTHAILQHADVVVSTAIGAGGPGGSLWDFATETGCRFSDVLVDEAAQCTECALFPAMVLGVERLVLVGDQNQLPPVVKSPGALEKGLGISLFARLTAAGLEPVLLNEQYRMHPQIARFPSERFYQGLIKSMVQPSDRPLPRGFPWPNKHVPVCFIDTSVSTVSRVDSVNSVAVSGGSESVSNTAGSHTSFYNEAEVQVLEHVIERLLVAGADIGDHDRREGIDKDIDKDKDKDKDMFAYFNVDMKDIGIISPYSAQVKMLRDAFSERGWGVDLTVVGADAAGGDGLGLEDTDAGGERSERRRLVGKNRSGGGSSASSAVKTVSGVTSSGRGGRFSTNTGEGEGEGGEGEMSDEVVLERVDAFLAKLDNDLDEDNDKGKDEDEKIERGSGSSSSSGSDAEKGRGDSNSNINSESNSKDKDKDKKNDNSKSNNRRNSKSSPVAAKLDEMHISNRVRAAKKRFSDLFDIDSGKPLYEKEWEQTQQGTRPLQSLQSLESLESVHTVDTLNVLGAGSVSESSRMGGDPTGTDDSTGGGTLGDYFFSSQQPEELLATPTLYSATTTDSDDTAATTAIDKTGGAGDGGVEIRSVDGFQGREKKVILFSAVRSNRQSRVGFLRDWRRLNVALTRAKNAVVVVGDISTLRNDPNWAAFIRWCEKNGCVVGAEKFR